MPLDGLVDGPAEAAERCRLASHSRRLFVAASILGAHRHPHTCLACSLAILDGDGHNDIVVRGHFGVVAYDAQATRSCRIRGKHTGLTTALDDLDGKPGDELAILVDHYGLVVLGVGRGPPVRLDDESPEADALFVELVGGRSGLGSRPARAGLSCGRWRRTPRRNRR